MAFVKKLVFIAILIGVISFKSAAQTRQLYYMGHFQQNPVFNVCVVDQLALLAGFASINCIDYTDFNNLTVAGAVPVQFTTALLANQQVLFLGGGMTPHFSTVDISSLPAMNVIGTYTDWTGTIYQMAFRNNYVYLTTNEDSLYVVDVSNLAAPFTVARFGVTGFPAGVGIRDQILYVGSSAGLHLYDLSNPLNPNIINTIPGDYGGLAVDSLNNRLMVATNQGLVLYNITNASQPVVINNFQTSLTPGFAINPVAFNGNDLFRLSSGGVEVFETGSGQTTALDDYVFGAQATGIAVKDSLVFVTTLNGLTILKYGYNDPTGMEEGEWNSTGLTLFPNPVKEELMIEIKDDSAPPAGPGLLTVFDEKGTICEQVNVACIDHIICHSLAKYASGVYFVSLYLDNNQKYLSRFIKQ